MADGADAAPSSGADAGVLVVEIDLRLESANRWSEHHFARQRRRAREHAAMAKALAGLAPPPLPAVIRIVRIAASMLDDDNWVTAAKACRDHVAHHFYECGDSPRSPLRFEYAQEIRREREVRRGPLAPKPKYAFRSWIRIEICSTER